MYIGDNDIVDLSRSPLSNHERLTWLNIDANKLSAVTLENLPDTLRTLSYCHNYVRDFPSDLLEGLPDLSRLYARGNYLRQLPAHQLRKAKRLDKLDLGENLIELGDTNASTHTLTIRDLHLDCNRIHRLPARSFRGISVARLYLARNSLQHVDEKALADLSNSLEYLDLEHNNLEEVPSALSSLKRLKYLYISSNRISNISSELVCPALKAISLAGNQLTRVPKQALIRCDKIAHLNLGYNFIREINESDFTWGSNLDTLLLRNNRLSEITANAFRQTPKLRELSLSFNKIGALHEHAFSDLKELESLEISFGLFQDDFVGDFLKPLDYLLWLSLDNNNINSLIPAAFHSLHSLQYLNLDTNAIQELPTGLFSARAHKHLKDIRLSNNYLSTVHSGTFADLGELQNVILSRNQLSKIENNSFSNLPSAASIILSGNQISKIEPRAFVNLPNLMQLDLQRNFIHSLDLNILANVSSVEQPLSINVSHNELHDVKASIPLYLNHVDMSVNSLSNVPHKLLQHCAGSISTLDLSWNRIAKLSENAFCNLTQLRSLSLGSNVIFFIHKRAFTNLASLQILNVSDNRIEFLSSDTLSSMRNLRILNLSHNNLRSLPRDLFTSTVLESLDLSSNLLNVMPSSSISEVGATLRRLDLSSNHIEHLDSTMFTDIPTLVSLNLANNKLNILPDNVFTSIGNLLNLDLSSNPLRANFKELFHYVQKLKTLNLADTGLNEVPNLPLPNLVTLRLSHNHIGTLATSSVISLMQLRHLYLDNNQLGMLPANAWPSLHMLKELDVSNNPIKVSCRYSTCLLLHRLYARSTFSNRFFEI